MSVITVAYGLRFIERIHEASYILVHVHVLKEAWPFFSTVFWTSEERAMQGSEVLVSLFLLWRNTVFESQSVRSRVSQCLLVREEC